MKCTILSCPRCIPCLTFVSTSVRGGILVAPPSVPPSLNIVDAWVGGVGGGRAGRVERSEKNHQFVCCSPVVGCSLACASTRSTGSLGGHPSPTVW